MSKTAEHTKGPWTWQKFGPTNKPAFWVMGGEQNDDAILRHLAAWPVKDANARLIAAAPSLFEELEEAVTILKNLFHDLERIAHPVIMNELQEHIVRCNAAITKARKGT